MGAKWPKCLLSFILKLQLGVGGGGGEERRELNSQFRKY